MGHIKLKGQCIIGILNFKEYRDENIEFQGIKFKGFFNFMLHDYTPSPHLDPYISLIYTISLLKHAGLHIIYIVTYGPLS